MSSDASQCRLAGTQRCAEAGAASVTMQAFSSGVPLAQGRAPSLEMPARYA